MSKQESNTISVIMSVYNNEKYLDEAISSVLNQTYSDFEFIITDDASTDSSRKIIKKYAEKDTRIKIIENKKNIGLTKSLNNMIDLASGEFIARMDGDDICLPNRFELQVQLFKDKAIQVCFGDTILIDNNGNILCPSWRPKEINKIMRMLKFHNYIPHPTVMLRKEVFQKYGKYNIDYITGQDKELWKRLHAKRVNFYYIQQPLLMYRINPSSVRTKSDGNYNYKIASTYIANKKKRKAFQLFSTLHTKEKILLILKLFSPHWFIYIKSIVNKLMK